MGQWIRGGARSGRPLIHRPVASKRIGRSNHRLDQPSRAVLVPGNRFEMLECRAAKEAVLAHDLDVLAQHIWGSACAGPFAADALSTK